MSLSVVILLSLTRYSFIVDQLSICLMTDLIFHLHLLAQTSSHCTSRFSQNKSYPSHHPQHSISLCLSICESVPHVTFLVCLFFVLYLALQVSVCLFMSPSLPISLLSQAPLPSTTPFYSDHGMLHHLEPYHASPGSHLFLIIGRVFEGGEEEEEESRYNERKRDREKEQVEAEGEEGT